MRYLSVCSGIEAATVAWHHMGWEPLAFSEIEAFPRAVLAHYYPHVPLHGDFTKLRDEPFVADADILVGGTPCQAFSVAGKRQSLADGRGNLTLEFVRLADAIDDLRRNRGDKPAIIVWENVPGVLSVRDNAFGCFLGALVGSDGPLIPPRGKWTRAGLVAGPERRAAWRVLDAQYFGVAQRRRRVFVVASARTDIHPAEVLFEREGLRRDTPPRREAREGVAPTLAARTRGGGGLGTDFDCDGGLIAFGGNNQAGPIDVATACNAHGGPMGRLDFESETFVAHCFDARQSDVIQYGDMTGPIDTGGHTMAVAFTTEQTPKFNENCALTLTKQSPTGGGQIQSVMTPQWAVRRLTLTECERLQGFPDGWTDIPWRGKPAADGPRYKALGNSMAVPVMRWIGERIQRSLCSLGVVQDTKAPYGPTTAESERHNA